MPLAPASPYLGFILLFVWGALVPHLIAKLVDSSQGWLAEFAWRHMTPSHTGGRRGLLVSWLQVYLAALSLPFAILTIFWLLGASPFFLAVSTGVNLIAVTLGVGFNAWRNPNPTARIEAAQRRAVELLNRLEAEAAGEHAAFANREPTPEYRAHPVRLARAIPHAKAPAGWTRMVALEMVGTEIQRVDDALAAPVLKPGESRAALTNPL